MRTERNAAIRRAWLDAHERNPIIVRPLRFLRDRLVIDRTDKGFPIMHPALRLAERAAKAGNGRALQLMAQRVNVHGIAGLTNEERTK